VATRKTRIVMAAELVGIGCAGLLAVATAGTGSWDLPLFLTIAGFAIAGDLFAIDTALKVKVSGSFLALVLAMIFLGGPLAALIGVLTIAVGWIRWRENSAALVNNIHSYAWFPLLGGLAFHAATDATGATESTGLFYVLIFATFLFALAINFLIIAANRWITYGDSIALQFRRIVVPVLTSEVMAALLAVGVAYLYVQIGLLAIGLFGVVLFTFQHLNARLIVAEQHAQELAQRTTQLATFQMGLLSAMLHTLDLRDRMTARHSAAVARYSKAIARAVGCTDEEQEIVHTAGLLHDIGKFIFPDHILKGNTKLTDEDWEIIQMHPAEGSRIVSQIDGYGPVGEIILGHHERIDGKGYPRQLEGEEIPLLSRIISVSDIYDVMTSRDSYRTPVSTAEAIAELQRVAGTQLDARLVDAFVQALQTGEVDYRHGEDADFDAELALDKRVHAYASPSTPDLSDSNGRSPAFPDPTLTGAPDKNPHRNRGRRRREAHQHGSRDRTQVGG
jgi:putative nucleotidyltransferase with HDIG domain